MGKCVICGKETNSVKTDKENNSLKFLCVSCEVEEKKREKRNVIEENLKSVNAASDFKEWKKEDLSEAFWIHLGRYQKMPNRRSLEIMYRAYMWAVHDDHGLSNSFSNALKWCGINILKEINREDLPESWEES